MRLINRLTIFIFVIAFFALVASCAHRNFVTDSYVTLSVGAEAYNLTMETMAELYQQGKITDAQWHELAKSAIKYCDAHDAAVDALAAYKEFGDAIRRQKAESAIEKFESTGTDFDGIAEERKKGGSI